MQIPLNACCLGGPVVTQTPLSAGAMFALAAIYAAGGFIVAAVLANALT
jgi:hypothetical protein